MDRDERLEWYRGRVAGRPAEYGKGGRSRELWPVPQAIDTAIAISADLLPNLARNPLGLVRAAGVAMAADLREEAAAVGAKGIPVLALSSEGDRVIPKEWSDRRHLPRPHRPRAP